MLESLLVSACVVLVCGTILVAANITGFIIFVAFYSSIRAMATPMMEMDLRLVQVKIDQTEKDLQDLAKQLDSTRDPGEKERLLDNERFLRDRERALRTQFETLAQLLLVQGQI